MTVGAISEETFHWLSYAFAVVFILSALFGLITNFLNVIVFLKLGLKDSVTSSFFYLSVTDLGVLWTGLISAVALALTVIEEDYGVVFIYQPFAINFYCAKLREMIYSVSVWTTTFLAVQRCLCVYMPLHFKLLFSNSKTVLILWLFTMYTFVSYIPVLSVLNMIERHDPSVNITRPVLTFGTLKEDIWVFEEAQNGIIFPVLTQIIVLASLFVLSMSLRLASEQRQKLFHIRPTPHLPAKHGNLNISAIPHKEFTNHNNKSANEPGNEERLSGESKNQSIKSTKYKEIKLVKGVMMVSFIFVVCNTPKIITGLVRRTYHKFDIGQELQYTYQTAAGVRMELELINAAVNLFVYYRFNSRFRQVLSSLVIGKTLNTLT